MPDIGMIGTTWLGLRPLGAWDDVQFKKDYKSILMTNDPNGDCPITAMLTRVKKTPTKSVMVMWETESFENMSAPITGVYTDAILTTHYSTSLPIGSTIYVKMAEVNTQKFLVYNTVALQNAVDPTSDIACRIVDIVRNGASSYLKLEMLQADRTKADTSDTATAVLYNLADATRTLRTGSAYQEGANFPQVSSPNRVIWYNRTQIFTTGLSITGTAKVVEIEADPQAYTYIKAARLKAHFKDMEMAFLKGVASEKIDAVSMQRVGTMMGIIPAIMNGSAAGMQILNGHGGPGGTVADFRHDYAYSGAEWEQRGLDWLEKAFANIMMYGAGERVGFCGTGALLAIQNLVRANSSMMITPSTTAWGLDVRKLVTAVGTLNLVSHPMMSLEPTMRYNLLIIIPNDIVYRPLRDTEFTPDTSSGVASRDATDEVWRTECTLEYHNPIRWGYLMNLGMKNVV